MWTPPAKPVRVLASTKGDRMVLRLLERFLALLFWALITAVALVIAVDVALASLDRPERLADADAIRSAVAEFDPTSTVSVGIAALLVVLGLVLLIMQLVPRRSRALHHHGSDRLTFVLDRRGLERRLTATVEDDEDVANARVQIRRRAKVDVRSVQDSDDRALQKRLRETVRAQLDELVDRRSPRIRVRVKSGAGRVR
jgi:hypothetical protein